MRRREFLGVLGCAAGWSIASKAQASERTRVVGILQILGADDPEAKTRSEIFAQALQQLGWTVGRDLKIEIRNVGSDLDHLPRYAAELIALTPDVIATGSDKRTLEDRCGLCHPCARWHRIAQRLPQWWGRETPMLVSRWEQFA